MAKLTSFLAIVRSFIMYACTSCWLSVSNQTNKYKSSNHPEQGAQENLASTLVCSEYHYHPRDLDKGAGRVRGFNNGEAVPQGSKVK